MPNKMLIDATHPEETRVVVVRGNRVEEFDFETAQRKQLRGNIYLAKVTRVEPSLQAAFIEYGGNRHGFLAFSEIHPDYYQIPVADRQALIEADERAHREAEEETENRSNRRRPRHRNSRRHGQGDRVQSGVVEGATPDQAQTDQPHDHDHGDDGHVHHTDGDAYQPTELSHHDHEGHEHGHTHDDHGHDHSHGDHSHDGEPPVASPSEMPAAAIEVSAPAGAEAHDEHADHDHSHDDDTHEHHAHDEHAEYARENAAHADDADHAHGETGASDHAESSAASHGDEAHC